LIYDYIKMKKNKYKIIRRVGLIILILFIGIDFSFAEDLTFENVLDDLKSYKITSKWQIAKIVIICIAIGMASEYFAVLEELKNEIQ